MKNMSIKKISVMEQVIGWEMIMQITILHLKIL